MLFGKKKLVYWLDERLIGKQGLIYQLVKLISKKDGFVLFSLQEDCHICNIDLNVQYFAVWCLPLTAILLVGELFLKSLVEY